MQRVSLDKKELGASPAFFTGGYWPRVWARCIDIPLAWLIASTFWWMLPSVPMAFSGMTGILVSTIFGAISLSVFVIGYDTIWVATTGTTPGKALLGLRVRSIEGGGMLPIHAALSRAFWHMTHGLFLMLFFPYIQIAIALRARKNWTGVMTWDVHGHSIIQQKPIGIVRHTIAILVAVSLMFSMFALQQLAKDLAKEEMSRSVIK